MTLFDFAHAHPFLAVLTPGEDPKVLAERVLAAWGELLARTHMT